MSTAIVEGSETTFGGLVDDRRVDFADLSISAGECLDVESAVGDEEGWGVPRNAARGEYVEEDRERAVAA